MKKPLVKFPKDESKHNLPVEWWYFNGNLKDKKGNKYAFMKCLFKIDPSKAGIPFMKGKVSREMYFSQSNLCDIKCKKFYYNVHPLINMSKESFPNLLSVRYTIPTSWSDSPHRIEKVGKDEYRLVNEFLDLFLKAKSPPLLEEEVGFIKLDTDEAHKTSYYYSLPDLEIKGKIFINGKQIEVSGQGWMDHQWSDSPFSLDQWNWFSVQLDNNTNFMCVEFGKGKKCYLASIMHPDGTTSNTKLVKLKPGKRKWKSPASGAEYSLDWEIAIPSEKIKLRAKALLPNTEMLLGTINYWEGPMEFSGTVKKKKVKGQGFMELVGYKTDKSKMKIFEKEIADKIKSYL